MVKKIFLILSLFFLTFFVPVKAQTPDDLGKQIEEYTQKLYELAKSKNTLSNQIKIIDTQIAQTQLKIKQTSNTIGILKKDIADLGVKIGDLDISLNELSVIYIHEINQNYKLTKRIPLISLITSGSFNNYFENYKYLSVIQKNSQETLLNLETTRTNLDLQKQAKAEKQKELEAMEKQLATQQKSLATQKTSKNKLLEVTKNDEEKYRKMLESAYAELSAINAIIAGNGTETTVRNVSEGEKIASIISGASCSSSGTHLHFMAKKGDSVQNPFSYLKSTSYEDHSSGDSFNPSGSWNWPVKGTISLEQGYGKTWSILHTWVGKVYSFHTGIDINGSSGNDVYSTQAGTLYKGSYYISSQRCSLRYVRVEKDGLSTLNLHVNY